MKRFLLLTSGVAILTANLFCTNASASELEMSSSVCMEQITHELESYLTKYYEDVYTFTDFEVDYEIIEDTEAGMWINADLVVDMTLSRHPEESPFVMGMKQVKEESKTDEEKDAVQSIIDDYLNTVLPYYQVPYESAFLYRIYMESDSEYQIYECISDREDRMICKEIQSDDVYTDIFTCQDGAEYVNEKLSVSKNARAAITISGYNAVSAVNYAIQHATDEPEFANKENDESDCANFVSKCINAGGIPTDVAGEWYPATVYGNIYTCGVDWMRTGYNNNGGVVPHFLEKGYIIPIVEEDVDKGCIMYWNKTSHVAIVTYYDGTTIKYSEHSDVKKGSVYYTYGSSTGSVTFYKFI